MRLRTAPLVLLLPLSLLACDGKETDDGAASSSDGGDGGDGEELPEEPDPNADDDGDGYLNGWEEVEGTDPNDAASVIYTGGWPTVYLLNADFTIHTRPGSPSDITYYDPVTVAGVE